MRDVREIGGNVIKSYESSYVDLTGEDMTYAADGTSYVTHQMVVDADIANEMLDVFVKKVELTPMAFSMSSSMPRWATAILSSLDRKDLKLGFSEYASYASYVLRVIQSGCTRSRRRRGLALAVVSSASRYNAWSTMTVCAAPTVRARSDEIARL